MKQTQVIFTDLFSFFRKTCHKTVTFKSVRHTVQRAEDQSWLTAVVCWILYLHHRSSHSSVEVVSWKLQNVRLGLLFVCCSGESLFRVSHAFSQTDGCSLSWAQRALRAQDPTNPFLHLTPQRKRECRSCIIIRPAVVCEETVLLPEELELMGS